MASDFSEYTLTNGCRVYINSVKQFKTIGVSIFIHQNLTGENVTKTALLPMVLKRGSSEHPTTQALSRRLEELYGAEIHSDVLKVGDRHIINIHLEMVNERFIPAREGLLKQGLKLLAGILTDPVLENGHFKREYVEQEKDVLKRNIEGLINDKTQYAIVRLHQEMCKGEAYGLYKYGQIEDLPGIDEKSLYQYYREVLAGNPVDIFFVGDVDQRQTLDLIQESFGFTRQGGVQISPALINKEVGEVKTVIEEKDVSQGKLAMGFRTYTTSADEDFDALVFYDGILGSFPHSKLFQNVREKASLAYFAYSRLEASKGLMTIASGIEPANYEKTVAIIKQQLDDMQKGNFSDYEFDSTRKGLINRLKASQDSPGQRIYMALEGIINGRPRTTAERIAAIEKVTKEQVVNVAQKIKLDTIFFLTGSRKGGAS